MFPEKLNAIKRYLDFLLTKKFIQASLVFYSLPILFVKKVGQEIWFCIDYKRLNAIIKKDCYSISLIEKTLAQLKGAKYFTKLDIC